MNNIMNTSVSIAVPAGGGSSTNAIPSGGVSGSNTGETTVVTQVPESEDLDTSLKEEGAADEIITDGAPDEGQNSEDENAVDEENTLPTEGEDTAVDQEVPVEGEDIAVDGISEPIDGGGEIIGGEGNFVDPGMEEGMPMEGTVKDPLLSSMTAVVGISCATLFVGAVIGVLIAVRKIKKGFGLYED